MKEYTAFSDSNDPFIIFKPTEPDAPFLKNTCSVPSGSSTSMRSVSTHRLSPPLAVFRTRHLVGRARKDG
jgi:hypothetical protein